MPCQVSGLNQGSGLTTAGIYPRTITISRIPVLAPAGNVGYRAPQQSLEVVILKGLPCSIDFYTRGPDPLAKVPSDAVGRTLWYLYIPADGVRPGTIKRDDIATDDLGRRYKCNEPNWGAIDVQIEAELLRT